MKIKEWDPVEPGPSKLEKSQNFPKMAFTFCVAIPLILNKNV